MLATLSHDCDIKHILVLIVNNVMNCMYTYKKVVGGVAAHLTFLSHNSVSIAF